MVPPINPLMNHFLGITQYPTSPVGFGGDPPAHLPIGGGTGSFGGPIFGSGPPRSIRPLRPTRPPAGPMPPLGPQRSIL